MAGAFARAGIVGPGRETAERGDLLVVAAAELGKPCHERHGDDRPEAGNRQQNRIAAHQGFVGLDPSAELRLDGLDVRRDPLETPPELAAQEHGLGTFELVCERRLLLDGTDAGLHQFLKRFNEFRRRRPAGIPQLVRKPYSNVLSANTASMRASSRSVLPSKPMLSANRRARNGLTTRTS